MKRLLIVAVTALGLAVAGPAGAALVPTVFDPGRTSCPRSVFSNGVLHLEKNCVTTTNASAGANITGENGRSFTSASFTLAGASQCQGGSPRFNIQTTGGMFFLGCNNVTPVTNGNGTVTYTFTAATLAAAGQQVPTPTGTITGAEVLIDVQGTADLTMISVNAVAQTPAGNGHHSNGDCKKGGWKTFTHPSFKNQGQCVSSFNHGPHGDHRGNKGDDEGGHKGGHKS
jgi:hypothetical protein